MSAIGEFEGADVVVVVVLVVVVVVLLVVDGWKKIVGSIEELWYVIDAGWSEVLVWIGVKIELLGNFVEVVVVVGGLTVVVGVTSVTGFMVMECGVVTTLAMARAKVGNIVAIVVVDG